jgi:hypothetical protein
MQYVFLVLGYGVPKRIEDNASYNAYLRLVLNQIYESTSALKIKNPIIIFCGGKTDIYRPYRRDEAHEMQRLFKIWRRRTDLKKITKGWKFLTEDKSLSTLENLLFSRQILRKRKIKKAELVIFCEMTRQNKVSVLARKVFKNFSVKVRAIDFDISPNRYLALRFIRAKEREELKLDLWALKSEKNLRKYHKMKENRVSFIRKRGVKNQLKAVKEWWDGELNNIIWN